MKMATQSLLNSAAINYLYWNQPNKDMAKLIDLTGKTFGRLKVISRNNNHNLSRVQWDCVCNCGSITRASSDNLISGHTQSCGCLMKERITRHGYSGHKLYAIWEGIVGRCCNPKSNGYKDYGARGILLYQEWREKPGVFIDWCLNNGWKDGLSIERNDCNGNYEPSNCSFIPLNMQQKNTRKSHRLLYNGKIYTQRDLAKEFGIHNTTLRYRIKTGKIKFEQEKNE